MDVPDTGRARRWISAGAFTVCAACNASSDRRAPVAFRQAPGAQDGAIEPDGTAPRAPRSEAGSGAPDQATPSPGNSAVLFDTDMGPDVDDAGALAVLHALADAGELTLLGVMISTTGDAGNHAIGFVDAVDTYYGRPDLPIGLWKGGAFASSGDGYPAAVSQDRTTYPHDLDDASSAVPDATTLYRRILAAQPDGSVTVVCTGMMNELKALLESGGDAASPLDGRALVRTKVARLVQMGGAYPQGSEFNFVVQPSPGTTRAAVDGWPTPIVFSGFEIGAAITTGASLEAAPADNPVRTAYAIYTSGTFQRPSWDLTAVLYAVRGAGELWDVEATGSNAVGDDGANAWRASPDLAQSYLKAKADPSEVAAVLDELISRLPAVKR
jgi:inosine-uridine nucleoside N-ribohydrolase